MSQSPLPNLPKPRNSTVTVRFIVACSVLFGVAFSLATAMYRLWPPPAAPEHVPGSRDAGFPPVFWGTTLLLVAGSVLLQHARNSVRLERQRPFRRALLAALAAGTAFVAIQTYGIAWLVRHQQPEAVETGANAFVTCLTALHAMHFTLAMMLLVWVTLQACSDRYDHEYSWGVTVCAWFWHALGVIWMLILVIFALAAGSQA